MDSTHFEGFGLDGGVQFFGAEQEFEEYTLPQSDCPSIGSSFLTIDTSSFGYDVERRGSICSTSPGDFGSSTASVPSPITPIGPMSMMYTSDGWMNMNSAWTQNNDPFWTGSDESSMSNCVMSSMVEDDPLQYQQGYFYPVMRPKSAIDPPLSRAVFQNSAILASRGSEELMTWPEPRQLPSNTIEPRATFSHTLPSSPLCKMEPVTPTRNYQTPSIFDSSPFPLDTSTMSSPWEEETLEPKIGYSSQESIQSTPSIDLNVLKERQPATRKRVSAGPTGKYDEVIPTNNFRCSMCSKRFKRAEHRKRHEDTVQHDSQMRKKAPKHCWVVTGGKECGRDFSRGDNLQSHLRKTHGRRSANQRNSYVATLDPASKYYDPEWTGQLTTEGLPIDHPKWPDVKA